jgi:hypothetical protein
VPIATRNIEKSPTWRIGVNNEGASPPGAGRLALANELRTDDQLEPDPSGDGGISPDGSPLLPARVLEWLLRLALRQRVEKGSLERKPCTDLSDTRVVQLDVRVIAEVGIRYTYVRSTKDHVVERIQCLETER